MHTQTVKYIDIHPLGPITLTTGPQICTETVYSCFGASKMHENEEGGELEEFRTYIVHFEMSLFQLIFCTFS